MSPTAQGQAAEAAAARYAHGHDSALRAEVVEQYQWLVVYVARRMQRRSQPLADLIQVCNVGLLEALDRYDPARQVTFGHWAGKTMEGVVRHHYRGAWGLRVTRSVQELNLRVAGAVETLSAELQRTPTTAEVADRTHASNAEVVEAVDAGVNFWPLSLTYDEMGACERMARTSDDLDSVDTRVDLDALLDQLPADQRRLLTLRYIDGHTQAEAAAILGIKQVAVSRSEHSALRCLRSHRPTDDETLA